MAWLVVLARHGVRAHLFEVADLAGSDPVHLVGESMGGTVVLAAALERPERVASVTISNAAYKGAGIGRLPGWRAEIERDGIAAWSERMMSLRFVPSWCVSSETFGE